MGWPRRGQGCSRVPARARGALGGQAGPAVPLGPMGGQGCPKGRAAERAAGAAAGAAAGGPPPGGGYIDALVACLGLSPPVVVQPA